MKIIESREKDIEAFRNLFLKTRLTAFSWVDTSPFKLSDFEEETEGEYILVALVDSMVIGFTSVWVAENFIHHLYVDERFRNRKVGTELLNAVIDKFDLPVRLKCEKDNVNAVRFYQLKGFVEKERRQSEFGTYILFELGGEIE